MKIVPGDIVTTNAGWSISKLNTTMIALGQTIGDNLLVVSVNEASGELCLLTEKLGLVWVHNDRRSVSVVIS